MPKKVSKTDFEKIFNELFGTNIQWSKLSRDELVELATVLNHPAIFLAKLGVEQDEVKGQAVGQRLFKAGRDFMSIWVDGWSGPLAKIARNVFEKSPEPKQAEESSSSDIEVQK